MFVVIPNVITNKFKIKSNHGKQNPLSVVVYYFLVFIEFL